MVSMLVLSWNHEKFIEQSIRSVINQTYRDIEIIYLDNNSSDNTFSIAENILKQTGVKYQAYKRSENFGIAHNQNFLFGKSHGDYISFTSGDDWLDEKNIEEKMKVFERDPAIGMVYSTGYKYYEETGVYELIEIEPVKKEDTLTELFKRNFISGIGCIIRRKVIEHVGLWDESQLIEDGDMWIKIAMQYEIAFINKPLFFYRQHINAVSKDPDFMYKAKMQWFEKYKHLNKNHEISLRNIWENYLANKVMVTGPFAITGKILKNFRLNKLYTILLIKSFLPASWKKWYFKRSLKRKNKHINPDDLLTNDLMTQ